MTSTSTSTPHQLRSVGVFDQLDPRSALDAAAALLRQRRQTQVDEIRLLQHWADLHGFLHPDDPSLDSTGLVARRGGNKLIRHGGDGNPVMSEFAIGDLAMARQQSIAATEHAMADALDLRHRLPRVWDRVQELVCETWVACKVARMSRQLDSHAVELVDVAVAEAIGSQAPSRVLRLAEAKVIEADPAAHAATLHEALTR